MSHSSRGGRSWIGRPCRSASGSGRAQGTTACSGLVSRWWLTLWSGGSRSRAPLGCHPLSLCCEGFGARARVHPCQRMSVARSRGLGACVASLAVFSKLLSRILMSRIVRSKWLGRTIGLRPGHQTAETHAALQILASRRREFGRPWLESTFIKALDKCRRPLVRKALSKCTEKSAAVALSIRGHCGVKCRVDFEGGETPPIYETCGGGAETGQQPRLVRHLGGKVVMVPVGHRSRGT